MDKLLAIDGGELYGFCGIIVDNFQQLIYNLLVVFHRLSVNTVKRPQVDVLKC